MRPEATFVLAQCACAHPGHHRTPTYPTILGSRLLSRNSAAPLRVVNTNGTNLTLSMMRDGGVLMEPRPGSAYHCNPPGAGAVGGARVVRVVLADWAAAPR